MKTVEMKRPEKFMGIFYKGFFLKSAIGKAYQIHTPFLDPNSKSYFLRNQGDIPELHIREADDIKEDEFEELSEDETDEEDMRMREIEQRLRKEHLLS